MQKTTNKKDKTLEKTRQNKWRKTLNQQLLHDASHQTRNTCIQIL